MEPLKNERRSPRPSVTITDVAKQARVSKSTVSLVLQDSPLIARDTAEQRLAA